ncbi:universal stress protein [uncultured Aeromicrobium sp.]|uniref:universal stress protein n=1 Tax=uncultured Aeromicrobium sp. TaxID=337820 RepID=UPI0025EBAE4C|nr:universal stress protein [uncultured Aeromicrobium sp.]
MTDTSKIVVGLDDSDAGAEALRWAAEEAQLRNAELEIVHVWQLDPTAAMGGYAIPWLAVENDIRAQAQSWVEKAIGRLDDSAKHRLSVVNGVPGAVLVDLSRDADMLVLGTQVHKGLSRMFQGSVSHYCLTHASTIVVAVPARVDSRGDNAPPPPTE